MAEAQTDCRQVLSALYAYLDGEQVDCPGIEAHLEACRGCMSHADVERAVKAVVRRACGPCGPEEMPPGLDVRIRSIFE